MKVFITKRKWGKTYTIIQGLDPKEFDLKGISKSLRTKLACGGTVKDDNIELQGDHQFRILPLLEKMGFDPNAIDIVKK